MPVPALTILDTFNRVAENPMKTAGWTAVSGFVGKGQVASGASAEQWGAASVFAAGKEDGDFWNATTFTHPFIGAVLSTAQSGVERFLELLACLQNPTTEFTGYALKLMVETAPEYKLTIERVSKGVRTVLLTKTKVKVAAGSLIGLQVTGGNLIVWTKEGEVIGSWTVLTGAEVADSTWTTGNVGMAAAGNIGRWDTIQAGNGGVNKEHTMTTTPQGSSATMHKTPGRVLAGTQAQAATRAATSPSRVFNLTQASSYATRLPVTTITEELEEVIGFNEDLAWTILSWAEIIGEARELNKGLTLKPHPAGWGTSEAKKAGARYNVFQVRDPINYMTIRNVAVGATENTVALGICVPSSGERSGYVARIEATATVYKVTLERWVNGVKTVLAETTVAEGFFGAAATGKAAPFALTLVGGTLRLWLAASGTAPTVLLSASDATFTSGYNTMEVTGTSWLLSKMHVASMDGQILLEAHPSKGQLLQTTQGQIASLRHEAITRTLVAAQGQGASFVRAITRRLTATQAQAAGVARAVAHSFTASQSQSASRTTALGRTLSTTQASSTTRGPTQITRNLSTSQASSPSISRAITRALGATQGQAAEVVRALARRLAVTQGSTASQQRAISRNLTSAQSSSPSLRRDLSHTFSFGLTQVASLARTLAQQLTSSQGSGAALDREIGKTLTAGQAQTATQRRAVARTLEVGQPQAASRQTAVSRLLAPLAASSATLARALARTLRATQAQVVAEEGVVEHHGIVQALTATQGQAATLSRTPSRRLSATAGSSITMARSVARTLVLGASTTASLRGELPHGFVTSCTQSASLGGTQVRRSLVATQPTVVVLARAVGRSLTGTQPQAIVLIHEAIEVPLPPPVNMSSSTTGNASASTAASAPSDSTLTGGASESSAVAKPPSSSVGGAVLTSSVEAR